MGGWNIPLAVQPAPQNPGPLELYKEGLSVQTLVNQQALQKQAQQQNANALQSQQIQLAQQQRDQQDQAALRDLAPKYANKDGNGTFDFEGLANEALQKTGNLNLVNNLRQQRYQMIEAASKAGSEQLANEQAHNKAAYEVIEGVKGQSDPVQRQTAYAQGLNRLKMLGVNTSTLPANAPNDDALEAYESQLGMHGQLLDDAKKHADTNKANAEAADKEWQKFPEMGTMLNTRTGEQRTIQGGLVPPGQQEAKYLAIETKKNQGQPLSPEESAFAKSYRDMKAIVPIINNNLANNTGAGAGPGGTPAAPAAVAKQFGMSQEAFDQAAEKYSSTGQLPAVGRGPSGIALQRALMNRAGDLHPGQSLSANSSEYKANTQSLGNLQKQFDAVSGFENTAIKNIDQLLDAAKAIPDLGARYANIPVRMVTSQMIGTEGMARLHAALLTAQTESAKVLNSATGSGVLTNEARKEAQDILDGNLPFPALLAAANQLKTDMGNRHTSYQDQINDIKKRLGSTSGGSAPTGNAAPAKQDWASQFGGVVRNQ